MPRYQQDPVLAAPRPGTAGRSPEGSQHGLGTPAATLPSGLLTLTLNRPCTVNRLDGRELIHSTRGSNDKLTCAKESSVPSA